MHRTRFCHWLLIFYGATEILLFSGLVFGWGSLVYVLKQEGYMSDVCATAGNNNNDKDNDNVSFTGKTTSADHAVVEDSFVKNDGPGGGGGGVGKIEGNATDLRAWLPSDEEKFENGDVGSRDASAPKRFGRSGGIGSTPSSSYESRSGKKWPRCKEQDEQFNLVFSISTCFVNIVALGNGWIIDRFGIRAGRLLGIMLLSSGSLMMAFSDPALSLLLFPAMGLMTYGGHLILMANMQLANLIPRRRSTIISFFDGAYDSSAFSLLLAKIFYDFGLPVQSYFVCVTASCSILLFSTFCFMPKLRVPWPLPDGYSRLAKCLAIRLCLVKPGGDPPQEEGTLQQDTESTPVRYSIVSDSSDRSSNISGITYPSLSSPPPPPLPSPLAKEQAAGATSAKHYDAILEEDDAALTEDAFNDYVDDNDAANEDEVDREPATSSRMTETAVAAHEKRTRAMENGADDAIGRLWRGELGFTASVRTAIFLWVILWVCIIRVRMFFFVGTFNPWLTKMAEDAGTPEEVSRYTYVFAVMQFFGITTAPLIGFVMDRKGRSGRDWNNKLDRIRNTAPAFALNTFITLLMSVSAAIPVLQLQFVTFVLHVLQRSFLFGPSTALIAILFPSRHFGKMFGTTLTCSALAGLLQFPLFLLVQNYLDRDPLWVNVGFMIVILTSFGLPLYVIYFCKAVKRRIVAGVLAHISIHGKPTETVAVTENAGLYREDDEKLFIAEYLSSV